VEPRNIFRHKSLALGRASGAESGVDHSSVDGRAMLQSVKKKLVSCRAPAAVLDQGRVAARAGQGATLDYFRS